jgi:endonuclease/exonuclease/phosphatase family metal-dependent hydrolase
MPLKVMSFNIRCASAPDGEHCWANRRQLVIERIRAFAPDLLGLQECRDDEQAAFVRAALAEYEFVGVRRRGEGDSAVEMAPLMYRRGRFDELQRGHFWLGTEPDKPGCQSWGAAYPRTASWVRLQLRAEHSPPFAFVNTHFDYQGTAREESARLLNRWVRAAPRGEAAILSGDFNAERDSEAFRELTAGGVLHEALQDCGVDGGSYHDYGRAATLEAIDWILASPQLRTEVAEVDRFNHDGRYPSDHFPVTAIFSFVDKD